jgi:hypothetical protein
MSTAESAAAVLFRLTEPTFSTGNMRRSVTPAYDRVKLDQQELEDFRDVLDAHAAINDPRNRVSKPWSRVKRSLKL